jgi:hypothetical protein
MSTAQNIAILSQPEAHWFCDGTFKTVPLLYEQLYTIHALYHGVVVPLAYELLANKTEHTYMQFFNQFANLITTSPKSVMTDFEVSVINALRTTFLTSIMHGCFYHLTQNIWHKIQEAGLSNQYTSDAQFRLFLKKLPALLFLPMADVVVGFEELIETIPNGAEPIVDYFEDTYIGRPLRHMRRPPRFTIDLWNNYDHAVSGLPRTNNNVEGWHSGFGCALAAQHVSTYKYVEEIRIKQNKTETIIAQLKAGQEPRQGNRKYTTTSARICTLIQHYTPTTDKMDFMTGIATNLSL